MRFRPILMTTMAALLGGVPLMLGTGTGCELRQPLGYTIVGGLLARRKILTLYTTPSSISISTASADFSGAKARPQKSALPRQPAHEPAARLCRGVAASSLREDFGAAPAPQRTPLR